MNAFGGIKKFNSGGEGGWENRSHQHEFQEKRKKKET
jgi:hypothetical protein